MSFGERRKAQRERRESAARLEQSDAGGKRKRKTAKPGPSDTLKERVLTWLRANKDATNGEVVAEFEELRTPDDVILLLHGRK